MSNIDKNNINTDEYQKQLERFIWQPGDLVPTGEIAPLTERDITVNRILDIFINALNTFEEGLEGLRDVYDDFETIILCNTRREDPENDPEECQYALELINEYITNKDDIAEATELLNKLITMPSR